jgi:hypothetical protein
MKLKVLSCILFIVAMTSAAHADRQAADECAKSLPANAKYIYEQTQASHPTEQTGRGIVIGIVEKMIAEGKLTLGEGETAGEAAGTCLEKMK